MYRGIDGFIFVCFDRVDLAVPTTVRAEIDIYVAQAGWHEDDDMLKVWAEVNGSGLTSLLTQSELGLRAFATQAQHAYKVSCRASTCSFPAPSGSGVERVCLLPMLGIPRGGGLTGTQAIVTVLISLGYGINEVIGDGKESQSSIASLYGQVTAKLSECLGMAKSGNTYDSCVVSFVSLLDKLDRESPLSKAIAQAGSSFNPWLWTGAPYGGLQRAATDAITGSSCSSTGAVVYRSLESHTALGVLGQYLQFIIPANDDDPATLLDLPPSSLDDSPNGTQGGIDPFALLCRTCISYYDFDVELNQPWNANRYAFRLMNANGLYWKLTSDAFAGRADRNSTAGMSFVGTVYSSVWATVEIPRLFRQRVQRVQIVWYNEIERPVTQGTFNTIWRATFGAIPVSLERDNDFADEVAAAANPPIWSYETSYALEFVWVQPNGVQIGTKSFGPQSFRDGLDYWASSPSTNVTGGFAFIEIPVIEAYTLSIGTSFEAFIDGVYDSHTFDNAKVISLLPNCATQGTKHNIDVLNLRDSATPGQPYTGKPNHIGDPALLPDMYRWTRLGIDLGTVNSARICAGLQSKAGAEALWIDNMVLTKNPSGNTTPGCTPAPATDYRNLPSCLTGKNNDKESFKLSAVLVAVVVTVAVIAVIVPIAWIFQRRRKASHATAYQTQMNDFLETEAPESSENANPSNDGNELPQDADYSNSQSELMSLGLHASGNDADASQVTSC